MLLSLGGCDLSNSKSDGGTTDANTATGTVGDQCTRISTAFCSREPGCAINGSITDCVAALKSPCCDQAGKCNSPAITPDITITSCVNGIAVEDCNLIANTTFPDICAGLPAL